MRFRNLLFELRLGNDWNVFGVRPRRVLRCAKRMRKRALICRRDLTGRRKRDYSMRFAEVLVEYEKVLLLCRTLIL